MQHILTINGGSSSIKFALFQATQTLTRLISGQIKHIGTPGAVLEITDLTTNKSEHHKVTQTDKDSVLHFLFLFIEKRVAFDQIAAVGHRIVHGGIRYSEPQLISPEVLDYLNQIRSYDPEHLPLEIGLIRAIAKEHPKTPQVACFDTAFHKTMPQVAKMLPIPRRYFDQGVMRFGFHGLSYTFLMDELHRTEGAAASNGKVILAHLGNGASMTAVLNGQSMDTTMAFTPAAGLVMSSRSGDLDPGLVGYLARIEHMTAVQFSAMANFEAGLLGVSETSADMSTLLEHEKQDPRAAEAVDLFCYSARKYIGAYAAVLNGLDTLVFAGGIGENAGTIRARICDGLQFLGVTLDPTQNDANAPLISAESSRVRVHVIKTDEEQQIARDVLRLI